MARTYITQNGYIDHGELHCSFCGKYDEKFLHLVNSCPAREVHAILELLNMGWSYSCNERRHQITRPRNCIGPTDVYHFAGGDIQAWRDFIAGILDGTAKKVSR